VDVGAVLATLLDRRLVRVVARKDVPGKPFLYGTTQEFLETFSLKDLGQLPTLKEAQELAQALPQEPSPSEKSPES
jgi:segregation and condensation protein B